MKARFVSDVMRLTPLAAAVVLLLATSLLGHQSKQESNPTTNVAAGVALYEKGDLEGAVKALRAAVKRDKSDAKAWHYLGLSLMAQGDDEKAAEAFNKAVELRQRGSTRNSMPATKSYSMTI